MNPLPLSVTAKPTAEIVILHGLPVRVWEATTDAGVPCTLYVALVRVDTTVDRTAFERNLIDVTPPETPV